MNKMVDDTKAVNDFCIEILKIENIASKKLEKPIQKYIVDDIIRKFEEVYKNYEN